MVLAKNFNILIIMKILLTFFVLLFSSSVFAEDISDFQIEGMSIGDSLLKHYSEKQINNAIIKNNVVIIFCKLFPLQMVRSRGLEPPWSLLHNDLNVARIPIPPRPLIFFM